MQYCGNKLCVKLVVSHRATKGMLCWDEAVSSTMLDNPVAMDAFNTLLAELEKAADDLDPNKEPPQGLRRVK